MTNLSSRVLVVDDEKLIRWSVAERLQRSGYEVLSAESGEQALEMVAANPPAAAIASAVAKPFRLLTSNARFIFLTDVCSG